MSELFFDVEDEELRNRNRAVMMANIYEDYCQDNMMSAAGVAQILGYFKEIPEEERGAALQMFSAIVQANGYAKPVVIQ